MTDRVGVTQRRGGLLWRVLLVAGVLCGSVVAVGSRPGSMARVSAADSVTGSFLPVTPFRLVDTGSGPGAVRLTAGGSISVQVAGSNGVPSNAVAVAVTVTVTGASSSGYATLWPAGEAMPVASTINFGLEDTVSNGAMIRLGGNGRLSVFSSVAADVVLDVTGAWVPASAATSGRFVAVTPQRLLDTRSGSPLVAGQTKTVTMPAGVPSDAVAAVVTLGTASKNAVGYFTAYAGATQPLVVSMTVDRANSVRMTTSVVGLSSGRLKVFSSAGGHLFVDVVGYFTGSSASSSGDGLFIAMSPVRRLDTRSGSMVAAGGSKSFTMSGSVAVANITVLRGDSDAGYATLFADGSSRPNISSVHSRVDSNQPVANLAVTALSSTAQATVFSSAKAHYVVDQIGVFTKVGTSTPTTTTTGMSSGGCSVSALLVPSCGAWLGASTAAKSGLKTGSDYVIGLGEYEAVAQNTPDILHFYKTGAQRFPTSTEISMAERPGLQRSILHYNWKPSGSLSWRQIADGGADAAIDTVAAGLKAYSHKVFFAVYHEPEDSLVTTAGSGYTAADYVAMYRRVVTRLRSAGVTNAVFVMNYMGFYGWAGSIDALWPGNDVVDWIAFDPYGFAVHDDLGDTFNQPWGSFPGFYAWATAKAPGKPIMAAEWGLDLSKQPTAPQILDNGVPILSTAFPMLKALVYWHDFAGNFSVRIDQNTELGRAYGAAYRRLANNTYFNSTSPSKAP